MDNYPHNVSHPIRNGGTKCVPDLSEVTDNSILALEDIQVRFNWLSKFDTDNRIAQILSLQVKAISV